MGQAGSCAGVPGATRVLTEEADPPLHGHGAGCGRHLSAQHLEQAGLARSVAPDETYFVTGATRNDASSNVRRPPTSTLSWRASSTPP